MHYLLKELEKLLGKVVYVDTSYKSRIGDNEGKTMIHNLHVMFSFFEDEQDDPTVLAEINMPIVESQFSDESPNVDEDYDMFDLMDAETEELCHIATDIGVVDYSEGKITALQRSILEAPFVCTLESLVIEERFRGMGIGKKIMEYIFDILDETANIKASYIVGIPDAFIKKDQTPIDVSRANLKVKEFFKACGAKYVSSGDTVYIENEI